MRRLPLLFALLALAPVFAPRAHAGSEHPPRKDHANHVIAGMKGITVTEQMRTEGHTLNMSGYGAAGFGEATLLDDRLALELDFVVTMPGDEVAWATEPLVKAPWHVTSWFEPYVAAGPMFIHVRDGEGERHWLNGGQVVLGMYVWFAEVLGIDIDVSFGAARGPDMRMVEFVFAAGPILRD